MIKTYKSPGIFSITIVADEVRKHINFYAYSNGGSYYETDSESEQEALESSKFFGKVFFLVGQKEAEEVAVAAEEETAPAEKKQVTVSGLQEAKEYLSDTFDYTRTSLRTKTAILAAAEEHNIEFVGI